ncbi:hypothetical protein J3U99_20045 [Brucella pituitosa]|uniref:capsular polysaccharide export protein, LipB/KpsS family n=1 Tax=Brucella pituitosa TaxID=571256 RepID=UPI002002ECED|nr:hypothetical protein [Brucella pituitosa]MCK4207069.1 hypothetical protein [Brucella pituitosa]
MSGNKNLKDPEKTSGERGRIISARFGRNARDLGLKSSQRVLLLQGPVGPFFYHLQSALEREGYDAWRICFTAGDRFFSKRKKRITFSQGLDHWSGWLDQFLAYSNVDCIILFGCERPIHSVARDLASKRGIPVISLEEGYIRPGYVTIERDGNNRFSPLAGKLPPPNFEAPAAIKIQRNLTDSFSKMCWYGFKYYSLNLLSGFSQRGTFHKKRSLAGEAFYWSRNFFRKIFHQGRNFSTIERLLEHFDRNFFVVPLQVADDIQLRHAAKGWTNEKLIIAAMASFAKEAGSDKRLVFKIHPLDRGHSNHKKLIDSLAILHGISDRVDVIDTGSLGLLVRHSVGMVTINSTSGLSAIAHGIPILVTGEAIYSHTIFATSATNKKDFDSFWEGAVSPDRPLCSRYLSWLKSNSLRAGDYYAHEGLSIAVEEVKKMVSETLLDKKNPIPFIPEQSDIIDFLAQKANTV